MNDDHDHDHANDNGEHERPGGKQVASAPAGGALTSLAALQTALANVPTGAYLGRTGLPMLLFKSRSNGAYMFGQRKTVPEPGSRWAVNPTTFMWGFVSFGANNKRAGEHLVPVGQPKPDITKLPDTGFPWQEEMAVNMKCLDGADAGVEVVFKATTDGALTAVNELVDKVRNQIESEQRNGKTVHDGEIVPIVLLENDSYPHKEHGKTYIPILTIVDWMPLSGPASAPAPGPEPGPQSPPEQPRRRRVA
jgi:hypothetical protein